MTDGVTSGLTRLSETNAAATLGSVEPHLETGEDVLAIVPVRPKGGRWSTLWGPRIEMTPATVELPKSCTVAVTSHRFLVVSYPLGSDDPSTMLVTRPLDEVRDVRLARVLGARKLSWTAGGTQYQLWMNKRTAKEFAQALQPKMAAA